MTATVPDVLDQLDWHHQPACEVNETDGPATHRATVVHCGCVILICTDCAEYTIRDGGDYGWFVCIRCHDMREGYRRDMTRILRLT